FFSAPATTELYTLSLHDALPIYSGPMHLAAAVGTPVIALFGPTDPARTGPYGAGHTVLRSGVPCSPCFSRQCSNAVELECLTARSEEHTSELQSLAYLVCRLLLE